MRQIVQRLLEAKIIDHDESGYYGLWTELGYLTPAGLRQIANGIDDLNKAWDIQIKHMYDRYLRVCPNCAKDREVLTLGIITAGTRTCQLCGEIYHPYPSLIHNPNYCEPPHETT